MPDLDKRQPHTCTNAMPKAYKTKSTTEYLHAIWGHMVHALIKVSTLDAHHVKATQASQTALHSATIHYTSWEKDPRKWVLTCQSCADGPCSPNADRVSLLLLLGYLLTKCTALSNWPTMCVCYQKITFTVGGLRSSLPSQVGQVSGQRDLYL